MINFEDTQAFPMRVQVLRSCLWQSVMWTLQVNMLVYLELYQNKAVQATPSEIEYLASVFKQERA